MNSQDFSNLRKKLDKILIENSEDLPVKLNIVRHKRIQTSSGSATIAPDYVSFNNSGQHQRFTWDEIQSMIAGKKVSDFYLDKTSPSYDQNNLVFTDGVEQEYHLPTSEIPKS